MKLLWSERAVRDLQSIGDYIASDSPSLARRHISKLQKKVRHVKQFPNSGRVIPEVGSELIREVIRVA